MRETERNTKGMYSWIGFRKKGIYYQQKERQEGQSKWGIMSLINLALNGIMSYTTAPLRLASILGLIVSTVAFAYLIYIIVMTNLYGDPVQGYPTIMVTMLFLGGVQLLSLGILGEYIARIFNEVKGRPGYFISSYNGKKTEK
jgi:glycosyltransferase involved in cell wall biosynthesis